MDEHRMTSRVLDIIEMLCENKRMTLSEIAQRLDASKSSLFPALKTLVHREYLAYSEESHRYSLGLKFVEIYGAFASSNNVMGMILDVMENLRNSYGETVHLGVLRGTQVTYIAKKDSLHQVRVASAVGGRVEAHASGLGKAILSCMTPEQIDVLYAKTPLKKLTEHTITDMSMLHKDLEEVRRRGYSIETCESSVDIMCVGAPIHDRNGAVVAALSVAFPEYRYDASQLSVLGDMLVRAIREVETIIRQTDATLFS